MQEYYNSISKQKRIAFIDNLTDEQAQGLSDVYPNAICFANQATGVLPVIWYDKKRFGICGIHKNYQSVVIGDLTISLSIDDNGFLKIINTKGYKITFMANGEEFWSTIGNTNEQINGTDEIPIRNGHTFIGWNINQYANEGEKKVIIQVGTEPITYYAIWEPYTYQVTLTIKNGSIKSGEKTQTIVYDKTASWTVIPYDGYELPKTVNNGSINGSTVTCTIGDSTVISDQIERTINVTVECIPLDEYTIIWKFNNDGIEDVTKNVYKGNTVLFPETPAEYGGYSFDGWYTEPDFSGTKITYNSFTATGKITYYAKWVENINYYWYVGTTQPTDPTNSVQNTGLNKWTSLGTTLPTSSIKVVKEDTTYTDHIWYIAAPTDANFTLYNATNVASNEAGWSKTTFNVGSVSYTLWTSKGQSDQAIGYLHK